MKYGWSVAMVAVALLLASCGGGSGPDTVDSSPSGSGTVDSARSTSTAKPQAAVGSTAQQPKPKLKLQHLDLTLAGWEDAGSAGIVMADKNGYFADAGLEVSVLTPVTPVNSVEYVLQGFDDLGVAPLPQVVLAREKGFPIVAVGSLIPQPTAAMIWLKSSGIDGIGDLKGKTVAIPGLSFQKDLLERILARAGLTPGDVKIKTVGYGLVSSLIDGSADAVFGAAPNIEGLKLELDGRHPVITPVDDLGLDVPAYEQAVVFTRKDRASDEPKTIRRFMAAVRRGTAAAVNDPGAAVDAIQAADEPNQEASRKDTEAEVEATLPLLSKTGEMSAQQARRLVAWMHRQGLIQRTPPVSSLLTNRYLAAP